MTDASPLPFSRPLKVDGLPASGMQTAIQASSDECAAVAQTCGLVAVKSLDARFSILPKGAAVRVEGEIVAAITQSCVVSLEPFDSDVTEPVDLTFMPEAKVAAWLAEHRPDPHADLAFDDDPPDAILNGRIDLGAIAVEFLTLALDPYPRKPGVTFAPAADGDEKDPSPFAVLSQLKAKT